MEAARYSYDPENWTEAKAYVQLIKADSTLTDTSIIFLFDKPVIALDFIRYPATNWQRAQR
jgi:hypothetical protein